jgi:hypothetical protein
MLPAATTVTGRVLDEQRRPIEQAVVFATYAELPRPLASYRELGPSAMPDLVIKPVRTDRDGTFRLLDVPTVPVRCWAVTAASCFAATDSLLPIAAKELTIDDLVCDPLPPGSTIRGRLVDVAGNAVADARVRRATNPGRNDDPAGVLQNRWFDVGTDGHFELPARVGVTFELLFEADGFAPQQVTAVVAGANLSLTLLEDH